MPHADLVLANRFVECHDARAHGSSRNARETSQSDFLRKSSAGGKLFDGFIEVGIGGAISGDQACKNRQDPPKVEEVEWSEPGMGLREFENKQTAARS